MRTLLLATILVVLPGCAMTTQHVRTMDGDEFSQSGGSLFSKQKYVHGLHAEFLPNNSGAIIDVKGEGDQDATALVPVIQAAVQAAIQAYTAGLAARAPQDMPAPVVPKLEIPR